MRWSIGGRKQQEPLPTQETWADRLRHVGEALDKSGLELQDLAVSITGEATWINGSAWWATNRKGGWRGVSLQLHGNQLVPGGEDLDSYRTRGLRRTSPWASQLRTVGLLMDGAPRKLHDPYILQVGDGFVVTAQVRSTPRESYHGPMSFGYTAAELAEARAGSRTGDRR